MRERASWMKPADDPILEYVRDAGEVTPAIIARNIDLNRKYVGRRCRALADHGMLESLEKGFYRLTELGGRYLDEELDSRTFESRNEGRRD